MKIKKRLKMRQRKNSNRLICVNGGTWRDNREIATMKKEGHFNPVS